MTDLTAKRTLVKSPPELWSELSEVESLARHLGEFGEIRITKLEPETTVAWEGEQASGTVEIEASGWGTKVTLTAAVVEAEEEPPEAPAAPPPDEAHASEPEPAVSERLAAPSLPTVPAPPAPAATGASEPSPRETVAAMAERKPPPGPEREIRPRAPAPRAKPARKGFLARLLGRGRAPEPPRRVWQAPQPPPAWTPPRTAQKPQRAQAVAPPAPPPVADAPAPQSPAPPSVTEPVPPRLDPERALAVLEGTLETLGSAHHRPFSRD